MTPAQRRVLEILRDYGPCTGAEIGTRMGHRVSGGTLRGRGLRDLIREEVHVTNRTEWHLTDAGRAALEKTKRRIVIWTCPRCRIRMVVEP